VSYFENNHCNNLILGSPGHLPVTETGMRMKWDNGNLGSNMRKMHPVISYRLYIEDNDIDFKN
jgi:hypothetical protein